MYYIDFRRIGGYLWDYGRKPHTADELNQVLAELHDIWGDMYEFRWRYEESD